MCLGSSVGESSVCNLCESGYEQSSMDSIWLGMPRRPTIIPQPVVKPADFVQPVSVTVPLPRGGRTYCPQSLDAMSDGNGESYDFCLLPGYGTIMATPRRAMDEEPLGRLCEFQRTLEVRFRVPCSQVQRRGRRGAWKPDPEGGGGSQSWL